MSYGYFTFSWFYPKEYGADYVIANYDVLPEDYNILTRRTYSPVTMGFEVEQPPIMFEKRICRVKHCHRDGSGPAETAFGVYTYPMAGLKEFMDAVGNDTWRWVGQYRPGRGGYVSRYSREAGTNYNGCGSHWHFRPNFQELWDRFGSRYNNKDAFMREVWATTWNSLMELSFILLPLQMWHYHPRFSARMWAKFRYNRYSPTSPRFTRIFDYYSGEPVSQRFTGPDCVVRDCDKHEGYLFMAMSYCATEDGCMLKPKTIEWRLPEVHPAMWATASLIIIASLKEYFERGFVSPKPREIAGMRPEDAYKEIFEKIVARYHSWVDVFEEFGPVEFIEGRGPRPYKPLRTYWRNMRELFNDMLSHVMSFGRGTPYYRVGALLKAGCSPYEQDPDDWWNILAPRGQFRWSNCRVETE